jgi:uncharacterized membrane protein YfcA
MSEFQAYLQLGFEHITDPNGYDHILFVVALCAIYSLREWKQVLILVTAFTLGHSLTLALATLQLVQLPSDLIELLIPVTILLTAVLNFFHPTKPVPKRGASTRPLLRYPMALLFGLIHGLGFSSYLRSLLGTEESILQPLLAFNLGLELGQILIVGAVLLLAFVVTELLHVQRRSWNLVVSGIIVGMALSLILTNELFRQWAGLPD